MQHSNPSNPLDAAEKGQLNKLDEQSISRLPNRNASLVSLSQLYGQKPLKAILLGRRASGRSTIVMQLLRCESRNSNNKALIFHGTEGNSPLYSADPRVSTGVQVHSRYDPGVLQEFMAKHTKERGDASVGEITIVFDNCFDMGSSRDSQISNLMHGPYNVIFVADHPSCIPLHLRLFCNYLFLFKENIYTVRRRIYDAWKLSSIFTSMEVYDRMYAAATNAPYGYLLINMEEQTCYVGRTLNKPSQLLPKRRSSQSVLPTIPEEEEEEEEKKMQKE